MSSSTTVVARGPLPDPTWVRAARHVGQEARVLLTSLRSGPPAVARGDLAQDLSDLRRLIQREWEPPSGGIIMSPSSLVPDQPPWHPHGEENGPAAAAGETSSRWGHGATEATVPPTVNLSEQSGEEDAVNAAPAPPHAVPAWALVQSTGTSSSSSSSSASPYARPFLQVIGDPRAAGPHTLVALRAVRRLLEQGTWQHPTMAVSLLEVTRGVLACKFEQTDPGADEAVEMAIADVLGLLVQLHHHHHQQQQQAATSDPSGALPPTMIMEAFHTVFITRNTFVHSPALSLHFEDVLIRMVQTMFTHDRRFPRSGAAHLVLDFITHQLLHTPLVGGDHLDESTREAQWSHDAIRVLCLRLVRVALAARWDPLLPDDVEPAGQNPVAEAPIQPTALEGEEEGGPYPTLLQVIQDGLCLSLLMTGQAIWAYHDAHTNISPGFVSLEVLTEICATMSSLWNTLALRQHLVAQFETILTGFYTRALVLLRKRKQPHNSASFNANLIFDAEVEIILESLVDILCLHNHANSIAHGDGGALETMFVLYDCHLRRSDVAVGLMVELCRCCGSTVNEEGEVSLTPSSSGIFSDAATENDRNPIHPTDSGGSDSGTTTAASAASGAPAEGTMVTVEHPWRLVPVHLKELCAQALMGGMKCLFRDDKPSAETMVARSKRKRSIMLRQVAGLEDDPQRNTSGHVLRDLKSKKRLMRRAASIFNKKASKGIEFLVDAGLIPDPPTPESVAQFLRNGIVVGLDKKAAGAYLGEAGKAPVAGKSPPTWERDWFHKDVLHIYCSLFRFENQSLLDGLRMFLASFRLPGEAQQIDRILQAFAESCGRQCEESVRLKLFSDDPKRAADAAYLLSFSIIMLNTDQHNTNIREDRKMSCEDFIKNNTDYGRDITERGKELPRDYLAGIYSSIREEEIRTEGEGADGVMTVERWKDVLRGSTATSDEDKLQPSEHDADDLTELVLEHVWKPIVSAIGALWGVTRLYEENVHAAASKYESTHSGMLGVQGARLGMDMAMEMLAGVRQLGRIDIFRRIFAWVCEYTGLLGQNSVDMVEKTWTLTNSVESQSAVVVAMRIATEAGEDLDEDGWRRVWSIIVELRDLKLLSHGSNRRSRGLMHESDPDLLTEQARREWTICLVKGDMSYDISASERKKRENRPTSVFRAFGRALFGSDDSSYDDDLHFSKSRSTAGEKRRGADDSVVWDEGAPSDDEGDADYVAELNAANLSSPSPGTQFESLLVRESMDLSRQLDMPITGLERVDETRRYQRSPRARLRERFRHCFNIDALVSDSRFMEDDGIRALVQALIANASHATKPPHLVEASPVSPGERLERGTSEISSSFVTHSWKVPLSPASEAFVEVLICEIAIRNRDRLKFLWQEALQDHYLSRLTSILVNPSEANSSQVIPANPGLEKRITGLLRLTYYTAQRQDLVNLVMSTWKFVLPVNAEQHATSPLRVLDRHFGEGLWRVVGNAETLVHLDNNGWEGLLSLVSWCASRGRAGRPLMKTENARLLEDDVALQCYRSLHLILHTSELNEKVPCSIVDSLRSLTAAGDIRNCSQLSIASLDLLRKYLENRLPTENSQSAGKYVDDVFWSTCWRKVVEAIAEAAEKSSDTNIRQHALSMLTDLFLDKQGSEVPASQLCSALSEMCVPLAGRCIVRLQMGGGEVTTTDELLIEFELCIGLIFKPLRHHLKSVLGADGSLSSLWRSVLLVLEDLLRERETQEEVDRVIPRSLKADMDSLVNEHLQNAIMVLISAGVLLADPKSPGDISAMTWESVGRMGINEGSMQQWKQAASQSMTYSE